MLGFYAVRITIVYDNYVFDRTFRPGCGFACVIETEAGKLLLDAGAHVSTLSFNLQKAGIPPDTIDAVAISHLDSDHYGGLLGFLEEANRPTVYVPSVFPLRYKRRITSCGARVEEVTAPREIFPHVFSTGQIGDGIKEQSLVLETPMGAVVVAGCGHPSISRIAEVAREVVGSPLRMMVGGFHLSDMDEEEVARVLAHLKQTGVTVVAPSHCTTDAGVAYLRREFGDGFVESGVGKVFEL